MDQAKKLRKLVKIESNKIQNLRDWNGNGSPPSKRPRVIAITSGKGGVGKTNIVVNLAIACQKIGKRVLIFDADLGLANIDVIFGINPRHNVEEVIKEGKALSRIIVRGPEGVSIIPASSGVQDLTNLTEGQKINLLNEFDILNSMFDMLLIDTGAGISTNVSFFNLAAEERIIVMTPEPTSYLDAYALIKVMFKQYGVNRFYLLLNMVKNEDQARSLFKDFSQIVAGFMGGISISYAGFIPRDSFLQEAVSRREPVICSYPEAASSKGFNELASYLVKQANRRPIDGNIKFFWNRLMNGAAD